MKSWEKFSKGQKIESLSGSGYITLTEPWFAKGTVPIRCLGWRGISSTNGGEYTYTTKQLEEMYRLQESFAALRSAAKTR